MTSSGTFEGPLRAEPTELLLDRFNRRVGRDFVLDNFGVNTGHILVGPGKDINEFFEKGDQSFFFTLIKG